MTWTKERRAIYAINRERVRALAAAAERAAEVDRGQRLFAAILSVRKGWTLGETLRAIKAELGAPSEFWVAEARRITALVDAFEEARRAGWQTDSDVRERLN